MIFAALYEIPKDFYLLAGWFPADRVFKFTYFSITLLSEFWALWQACLARSITTE